MSEDDRTGEPSIADVFGSRAAGYALHRPSYPAAMIDWLAGLAPATELAWDCAAGNGQAATLLADRFARVVATDQSEAQIAHARPHSRVEYRVAPAERSGLAAATVDLVTVAQALHWLPLEAFYPEVERVLKPAGVFAAWTYTVIRVSPEVDPILDDFYGRRVGRHWDSRRRHVEEGYASLPFPFAELPSEQWGIEARLDRRALIGYVDTWSAVATCRRVEGVDPLPELDAALARVWPENEERQGVWPIVVRVGRRVGRRLDAPGAPL